MRAALGLALAALTGCSSAPGVVFERAETELRWPPPPDTARIGYVGALVSDRDLKPSKSFGESVSEALFGKEPAQGMVSPAALCTDGLGRVFIADPGLRAVHVFGLETREYELWTPPQDQPQFAHPIALAMDPSGRLLVSDSAGGALFVFDSDGGFIGTLGDNRLDRPVGVAVDPNDGRIFVVDTGRHDVVVMAPDGEEITRFGTRGSAPGQFNYPTNIALDQDGGIYVSDSLNFRVQVFDADLTLRRTIGTKGDLPGYFAQPKGLAMHPQGHLYVVDAHFEAVQVFDRQGQLLMTFGREGREPGEFWLPSGVFIDEKGWIWIADSYNRRVQVFEYLPNEVQP